MKLDKKKVVFGSVIIIVILFIIGYTMLILDNDEENDKKLQETSVPKLNEEQIIYSSKKEAVDDIKEKREYNAPSLYDEKFLDSTGQFDPNLLNKEKQRVVDSIYRLGRIDYTEGTYRAPIKERKKETYIDTPAKKNVQKQKKLVSTKEIALEQQLFFAVNPKLKTKDNMTFLEVEVDGQQVIKANDRLQMRVAKTGTINGIKILRNTILYGIASFKPNRVLLTIENINHRPIQLRAYDYSDGLEGIYVQNSFRAEANNEIIEDMVDEISVPGLPQVKGLKKVFQRTNRKVKVTINDHYKLLLSTKQ